MLACLFFPGNAFSGIEITLGEIGDRDDYLCWGRVPAHVQWTGTGPIPTSVTITSEAVQSPGGSIGFANTRNSSESLRETLEVNFDHANGLGEFFVAGVAASIAKKDVEIVAKVPGSGLETRLPVMVRVRKDAERLTVEERDQFLLAFRDAARRNNQFAKYWGIHTDAIRMAHQVAFLPWHRLFLLNLERELQLENPAVALPYWEFDKPAPKVFSRDFLGEIGALPNPQEVEFSPTNPLSQFKLTDPRVSPLTRLRNGSASTSPLINKAFFSETLHGPMTSGIFGPYHGAAHVFIGGLVGDIQRSPADPVFFLLHANVDRAWAAWQRVQDRFNRTDARAYALQGKHSSGATQIEGNFEQDTMWPWDNHERPTEPVTITIGQIVLPQKSGPGEEVTINPQVGDMIDYLDLSGDGATHNYCYDTVPYGLGATQDFP